MTNQPIVFAIDRPSPQQYFHHGAARQHVSPTIPPGQFPSSCSVLRSGRVGRPHKPSSAITHVSCSPLLTRLARDHHLSSAFSLPAPVSYINSTTCDASLHRPRSIEFTNTNKFLLGYIPPIPLLLPTTIWSISPAKQKPKKQSVRSHRNSLSFSSIDRSRLHRLPDTNTQNHGLQPGSVRHRRGIRRAPHPSP